MVFRTESRQGTVLAGLEFRAAASGGGALPMRKGRVLPIHCWVAWIFYGHATFAPMRRRRIAINPGLPLDSPQRPADAHQSGNLLLSLFAQGIAHENLEESLALLLCPDFAGFRTSPNGRFCLPRGPTGPY